MRALQLHCDEVEYRPIKKEIAGAEEASTDSRRITESVLLLISVEKGDDDTVVSQCIDEMKKTQSQLKCDSFILNPYAHLSSDLASPQLAREILQKVEEGSKSAGLVPHHVPFGWNKSFSVRVKGHPLAEQSKVFARRSAEEKEKI